MALTKAVEPPSESVARAAYMPVIVRETPVVIRPGTKIAGDLMLVQHYAALRVEGFQDLLPEQLEIDLTAIAAGGEVRIDQIALPPCCEIIGVWFANPVVSVVRRPD